MGKPRGRMSGSERGKITEDVRKHAAEQGVAKEQTLASGMAAKAAEFTRASADVYAKV
jgi:phosphomethylpyrimidine synthase